MLAKQTDGEVNEENAQQSGQKWRSLSADEITAQREREKEEEREKEKEKEEEEEDEEKDEEEEEEEDKYVETDLD